MATRRIPVPKIEGSIPSGIISFLVILFFWALLESRPTKQKEKKRKKISTPQRFELWRAEPNRFLIYLLNHSDMVSSTGRLQEILIPRQRVRVVKEVDSKSTGLCPREFKSRRCRSFFFVGTSAYNHALVMVQDAVEIVQPPVPASITNSPVV